MSEHIYFTRLCSILLCGMCAWCNLCLTKAYADESQNIWIDSDPACTMEKPNDPDDCFAIHALLRAPNLHITGISLVYGNADLATVEDTLKSLYGIMQKVDIDALRPLPPIYKGAASALHGKRHRTNLAAVSLCKSLKTTEMTIVALGPLTNVASAFRTCPQHLGNVNKVIIVGGKRAGHIFHPAEDMKESARLKHGPVFRDMNIVLDTQAAQQVLQSGVLIFLTPYHLARQFEITQKDLYIFSQKGDAEAWIAQRSRAWLSYWQENIGRNGFYPFDLMAVVAVLKPEVFECAEKHGRVKRDYKVGGIWGPKSLLIFDDATSKTTAIQVCSRIIVGAHEDIREVLGFSKNRPVQRLIFPDGTL